MFLLKWSLKIILLPAMLLLTLIERIGIFLITPLSVLFNLLSWGMLIIAVLSYLMGLEDGAGTIRMIQLAFIIFIVPRVANILLSIVTAASIYVMGIILS